MAEPVSLDAAKRHLRLELDDNSEDAVLEGIISDARTWVENYTGQTLIAGEKVEYLDAFKARISTWPIRSIDSVAYRDADGVEQPFGAENYRASINNRPARLVLMSGPAWPVTCPGPGVVKVTMKAGYQQVDDIPRGMIRAMMFLIGGFYEDRETGGLAADVEAAARRACGAASKGWRL